MGDNWFDGLFSGGWAGGDDGWLNRLDAHFKGWLSIVTLAAMTGGCLVVTLDQYHSLLPLLPATIVAALLVGAVWMIRRRLEANADPADGEPLPDVLDSEGTAGDE